ncbi:MAG: TIGR02266 family protein [bacterium]
MAKVLAERRKHPRVPTRIQIRYQAADQFFTDYIHNLSLGGIFVETSDPLPVNTTLKVQFCLPAMNKPIVADGVVVRSIQGGGTNSGIRGMGIRFSDLDERSRHAVERYVAKARPAS